MSNYYAENADDAISDSTLSDIQRNSHITGLLGIDPLNFAQFAAICLIAWLSYLFIPRGIRFKYCGSYPKRYAWSLRSKRKRGLAPGSSWSVASSSITGGQSMNHSQRHHHHNMNHSNQKDLLAQDMGTEYSGSASIFSESTTNYNKNAPTLRNQNNTAQLIQLDEEESVTFSTPPQSQHTQHQQSYGAPLSLYRTNSKNTPFSSGASTINDEIAISTTMQQLRDVGLLIIAHGSKGKPKTVRLSLTENTVSWRTESTSSSTNKPKIGKSHQVPLSQIMYVDVGKQTTALRRVENASISERLCLSLLTNEGSLDLQASSPQERDALVNCFSLVLDEVHAQNWRDVYHNRAPSTHLSSSFDEFDGGGSVKMEV